MHKLRKLRGDLPGGFYFDEETEKAYVKDNLLDVPSFSQQQQI